MSYLREHVAFCQPPSPESLSCARYLDVAVVSEREARRLMAGYAISRPLGGYIHYLHATPEEIEAYRVPKKEHAKSELRNLHLLCRRIHDRRVPPRLSPEPPAPTYAVEPESGQMGFL